MTPLSTLGSNRRTGGETGEAYQDSGLLFQYSFGEPFNPMSLTREFQRLARKLGFSWASKGQGYIILAN
jgi:hypothetical protein